MKRMKPPLRKQEPQIPINLIRSIAWTFYKASSVNWDDLFGEACLAYWTSIQKYDPNKGASHITWAYVAIKNALINFCKKEVRHRSLPHLDWVYPWEGEPDYEFFERGFELSDDGKFILNMILSNPQRYSLTSRKTVALVKRDLVNHGWPWSRVLKGVTTLKEGLCSPKQRREVFLYN